MSTHGLASGISVGALLYQAECLVDKLTLFTDSDYPPQTVSIARLLKLLGDRARAELENLEGQSRAELPLGEEGRARDLGNIVQSLHSYLRYLHASAPLQTPPGIQQAITTLISAHATPVLRCLPTEINVLVRPQWRYSLKYVDILHQFESETDCLLWYALDPKRELEAYEVRDLVEALCKRDADAPPVPKHIAVLSFPGLDRDDVLLYPLLAHELGHFLDFASEDNDSQATASILSVTLPTAKEVEGAGLTTDHYRRLADTAAICLRELTADLLAARMVGLGYYFAFNEYFKTIDEWPGDGYINSKSGYPTFGLRLRLIWEELTRDTGGIGAVEELREKLNTWKLGGTARLVSYLDDSRTRASGVELPAEKLVQGTADQKLAILIDNTVARSIPAVQALVRSMIPAGKVARVPEGLEEMVELLERRVPPFQRSTRVSRDACGYRSWSFDEVLTAGWLYQLAIGDVEEGKLRQVDRAKEYRSTCLLLLKAIELQDARDTIAAILKRNNKTDVVQKPPTGLPSQPQRGGVLSGPSLRDALDHPDPTRRLVICPDFGDGPIEAASRDLHLGHWFRVFKRTSIDRIDLADAADTQRARRHGQGEVFVPSDGKFVLQPSDFVLAISLEYVALPPGIMAFVEGKSSLGRAGLLIATATQVAPGFKGCIVLELFNAGTVPVILRPAMRVAQLVLVRTDVDVDSQWLYAGRFQVQIRP